MQSSLIKTHFIEKNVLNNFTISNLQKVYYFKNKSILKNVVKNSLFLKPSIYIFLKH